MPFLDRTHCDRLLFMSYSTAGRATIFALLVLQSACQPKLREQEAAAPPAERPQVEPTPSIQPAPQVPPVVPVQELSALHARGTEFVNEQNERVILRGCNIGNWLLLEMWMWDQAGISDQQQLVKVLETRFGPAEARKLLDLYRQQDIGARDFEIIRSFGFNLARIPFDYQLLMDDDQPLVLRPDAFRWLDRAVALAKAAGVYVILDLHGAPGRQSVNHCTGESDQNRLWWEAARQEQTIWLWREIAKHYVGESTIAGYDLLNEPFGDYHTDAHVQPLVKLMGEVHDAIRTVDEHRVIFFAGPFQGVEVYGLPAERGWKNVGFTEHFYPGLFGSSPTMETHAQMINQQLPHRAAWLEKAAAPFLAGEFNVPVDAIGGPHMTRRYYDEFAKYGWASTLWSYKGLRHAGGKDRNAWFMVQNNEPFPIIDFMTATHDEIMKHFNWHGTMEYAVNERLRSAMLEENPVQLALAKPAPRLKTAPASQPLPGWDAADIGDALAGGQRVTSAGVLEVFGGGADIWGDRDQFRFISQHALGDFELTARVLSLDATSPFSKAGVMWRKSADPSSAHLLLHVFPDGKLVLGWRDANGAAMQEKAVGLPDMPVHLRITRTGSALSASYSINGKDWIAVERRENEIYAGDALAGLAVVAHDNNDGLTKARIGDLKLLRK